MIFVVYPADFEQVVHTEFGGGCDTLFSEEMESDDAVLDLHSSADVPQPVFVSPKHDTFQEKAIA